MPSLDINLLYARYHQRPNDQRVCDELAVAILDYPYGVLDLIPCWAEANHSYTTLASNGTFLESCEYKLGPNALFWLKRIERFLKGSHIGHTISINTRLFKDDIILLNEYFDTPDATFHKGHLIYDLKSDAMNFYITINDLYESYGKINLLLKPYEILYLMTSVPYRTVMLELGSKVSCINTDEPLLIKPPFATLDQMINWRNGENYYQCAYGVYHALPISSNGRNLLNYHQQSSMTSELSLEVGSLCDCGKYGIILKSLVRHSELPFNAILDNLSGTYRSIQFIQKNNVVDVAYVGTMPSQDEQLIRGHIASIALMGIVYHNKIAVVGQKIPIVIYGPMRFSLLNVSAWKL